MLRNGYVVFDLTFIYNMITFVMNNTLFDRQSMFH